ncbi:MAG: hypothetical protein AAGL89_17175 [Pseudomonadota bacterium]
MTTIITLALLVILVAVLIWNLHPPTREKMRGLSTVAEAVIMTVMGALTQLTGYYGQFVEALEGTPWRDYVPDNIASFVGYAILIWAVFKRLQTTSPVGKKL